MVRNMRWDAGDEKDNRIRSMGRWFPISSADEKAPTQAGVYVFTDFELQVRYVGKAGAGRLRDEIQDALKRGKGYGVSQFGWFATNSEEIALSLEKKWIDKYQPLNNDRK